MRSGWVFPATRRGICLRSRALRDEMLVVWEIFMRRDGLSRTASGQELLVAAGNYNPGFAVPALLTLLAAGIWRAT
jgi:hypothetical protein